MTQPFAFPDRPPPGPIATPPPAPRPPSSPELNGMVAELYALNCMCRDQFVLTGALGEELKQIRAHNWILTVCVGGMLLAIALIGLPFLYTAGTRAATSAPTQTPAQVKQP